MKEKTDRPEFPVYQIPEEFESYPRELSFGGSTPDEALRAATERLIAEPSKETAVRLLDQSEIETLRREYTSLLENEKPDQEATLEALLAEDARLKEKIRAQREVLQSISQEVNDKIRTIKEGTIFEPLEADRSLRIALDGRYLHYTFAGGRFVLAKVEPIPAKDQGGLFTRQTRNQEVFIRMFGCDFTPSDRFEELPITQRGAKALEGRRLAAAGIVAHTDQMLDEDVGEVITVSRTEEVVPRDTVLTSVHVKTLLEHGVESVVLYKSEDEDAPVEA